MENRKQNKQKRKKKRIYSHGYQKPGTLATLAPKNSCYSSMICEDMRIRHLKEKIHTGILFSFSMQYKKSNTSTVIQKKMI